MIAMPTGFGPMRPRQSIQYPSVSKTLSDSTLPFGATTVPPFPSSI
jgi:hypothetical protein